MFFSPKSRETHRMETESRNARRLTLRDGASGRKDFRRFQRSAHTLRGESEVAGQPGMDHELVLIDQSQLRQRERERHTSGNQSLARLLLQLLNGLSQIPADELCVSIDPVQGADTTYFFAASIVRAKGSVQSGMAMIMRPRID
jgi:hypothetical protein